MIYQDCSDSYYEPAIDFWQGCFVQNDRKPGFLMLSIAKVLSGLLIILFLLNCNDNNNGNQNIEVGQNHSLPAINGLPEERSGWFKDMNVGGVPYDLYIPSRYSGLVVLVLPGWNYPKHQWPEKNPQMIELAELYGAALIFPEMLVSIYASEYYEQTTRRWHARHPGGEYIREFFIPMMQTRHGLLTESTFNALIGLSTGGRGVALIALENPDVFQAGSALSGDFDQSLKTTDRLMTAHYGSYEEYEDRWLGRDNPAMRVSEWSMPIYIAHGEQDRIVPESQSAHFYSELLKAAGGESANIIYNKVEDAGHDYDFWGAELVPSFKFFDRIRYSEN